MDVLQISLLGIAGAIVAMVLRSLKRADIAAIVALIAGLIILIFVIGKLGVIVNSLHLLAVRGKIDENYFAVVLKIIGVAMVSEFGAQTCKDAGEGNLAQKVELGGKVAILALSIPILSSLMDMILTLVP